MLVIVGLFAVNHPTFLYLCVCPSFCFSQNNIPVFCPAITDGSIGDVIYFHTYSNPGLIVDLVQG